MTLPTSTKKITANDIRTAMQARWTQPEWAIMWEVAEATGTARGRYADAVMMSLWPSRGLELHGVEIKVSRTDWRREAADPRKAEAIAKYCDRWWIHTSPDVVDDLSALPPMWGLREWNGAAWKTIREAEKTDAIPVTRGFLAAMLRRADSMMREFVDEAVRTARAAELDEVEKQRVRFRDEVDRAAKRRVEELSAAAQKIASFEEAFGDDVLKSWSVDMKALGHAARKLSDCGRTWAEYADTAKRLRAAADAIDDAAKIVVNTK